MSNSINPNTLALDFDGVLCDGRAEYLESSWQVYQEIWKDSNINLEAIRPRFYELRSVIETGWEMPLLLRSLQEGISDTEIFKNWSALVREMLDKYGLTQQEMAQLLDEKRDRWLETDPDDWLSHHEFYQGAIAKVQDVLNQQTTQIYIITTKEGRFAKTLLEKQGIDFPKDQIIGKEAKQPKHKTLSRLLSDQDSPAVWFVEDRLQTLLSVADSPDLETVRLFLATWGYNTARSRSLAKEDQRMQLLTLDQFQQDFSQWVNN